MLANLLFLIVCLGVARNLPAFVKSEVIDQCFESLESDLKALLGPSDFNQYGDFAVRALKQYRKKFLDGSNLKFGMYDSVAKIDICELKKEGSYDGYSLMSFWKNVTENKINDLEAKMFSFLLPLAAMMGAMPAGESFDESVFSSSGDTLTKKRNRLSPMRIEQITVIRMFIRTFKVFHELPPPNLFLFSFLFFISFFCFCCCITCCITFY